MKKEPMWRRYDRFFGANRRKDADDEIRFHFEMRVRDYMKRGMSEPDARAAAAGRMGDLERAHAECNEIADVRTRSDNRREWWDEIAQDVRYGLRVLRRTPAFTAVAILTLAIGIGATTSVFSVVYRVLLASLPYGNPDRLVTVYEKAPNGQDDFNPVTSGNYLDWSARARTFSAMGAYSVPSGMTLATDGEPARVSVAALTPSAMTLLEIQPVAGRLFAADDITGGPVVVLNEGFWRRQFGGDPSIIGKPVVLNDVSYTVVGVIPGTTEFPAAGIDVWRAIRTLDPAERRSHNFNVIARLADGATIARAQDEMTGLASAIAAEHPEFMKGWGVNVLSLHGVLVRDSRVLLLVIIGAVAVVLLTACANLANLLLARAVAREREFVLRGALGARRSRIVRQLLTESTIVAVCGGTLGVMGAALSIQALLAVAPPLPFASQTRVEPAVILFAAGITILCTILFGLAPALRLSRVDLQNTLRSSSGSSGTARDSRLRSGLMVAQVALSVILLVGAGLLVRSFRQLQSIDVGYDPANVAMVQLNLPSARYQGVAPQQQFYETLLPELARNPAIRAAAASSLAPTRPWQTFGYTIEGQAVNNPSGRETPIPIYFILGDYFGALRQEIRQGRAFSETDRADAPLVAIVNESFAKRHWPSDNPIGKRLRRGNEGPWREVVGVVADARMGQLTAAPSHLIYMPYAQRDMAWMSSMNVLARVDESVKAASLLPAFRSAVRTVDPRLPVLEFTTVEQLYDDTIERRTFAMFLVSIFGGVALVLSVMGLYGLVSYNVAQQRREIGVRIALGASSRDVVHQILHRALLLVGLGTLIGLAGAVALTRFLTTFLYGVSPLDPVTFAGTGVVVAVVALISTCVPALRAAGTSPLLAMRSVN